MKLTIEEISKIINGKIIGDSEIIISRISNIEKSKKGDICFISNSKYEKFLYTSKASCVIVNDSLKIDKELDITIITVNDSYLALSQLSNYIKNSAKTKNTHSVNSVIGTTSNISKHTHIGHFSIIGENCIIEENVKIYNNCVIGNNVTIKKNSTIYSLVSIKDNVEIGENNIIHSGAIIGSDGFGFAPSENNLNKIQHLGNVITMKDVEIGSNTTIDKATLGSTIINKGVKLDNQIQIGHNVEIGENTAIAGLTAVAGSTKIGKNCLIGGQCAITGHIKIGDNVRIAGNSGIGGNIKDNQTVQGIYAFNKQDFQRSYIHFKRLPKLAEEFNKLKKDLSK